MKENYLKIREYIQAHKEEMVDKLAELVNIEGHFNEKENVEKARAWFQKELEAEGFRCWTREVAPDKAGMLCGILGEDRPGKPFIFAGHLDTVHYKGSFDKENPFYVEDGKAYGPGVLDMKGGLIIALYAVKALNSIGFDERPLKFIIDCEEESDHVGNDCDKMITEEAQGAIAALNFECGELGNRLCVQRKAQYTYYFTVHGEGGHAGNDFWRGKNAISEITYKIQEMLKLTDKAKETTVTPAVIKGGGHTSGIPDKCELVVDVRVVTEDEAKRVMDAMYAIAAKSYIEGTTTDIDYYRAKLSPLQATDDVMNFLGFINKVAEECGYEPFGSVQRGGATDAGNLAAAGIPVICAAGIRGDFAHNRKEYAVVDSMYDRAEIFACTVASIGEMK